jgi:FixJ family two-component response regulator
MENYSKKTRIFILDDDRYYGMFLKKALNSMNYSIEYFQKEQDCLKALGNSPDILILDHRLQNMTGLEILDEVNRKCKGKTQVIYLSGQEYTHIAIKALKEGAVAYIEKSSDSFNIINDVIIQIISKTKSLKTVLLGEKIGLSQY